MFHNETDVSDTNVTVILQQEKDEVQNNNYYLTYFHPHAYRWMMIVLYRLSRKKHQEASHSVHKTI